MKRKLLILNLALLGVLILGASDIYQRYQDDQARYRILNPDAEPKRPEPPPELRPAPQARAGDFLPIAERLLFSPDRNPVIEVEAPAPPPQKQRPPYPKLVGVMDLGTGPMAYMAVTASGFPEPVTVGQQVGEFKLLALGDATVTLEWDGKQMEVGHDKLTGAADDKTAQRPGAAKKGGQKNPPRPSTQPPAPSPAETATNLQAEQESKVGGKHNIGKELRPGVYAADPKDDAPDGTEFQDHVKRVRQTPFGKQAWWEKKAK